MKYSDKKVLILTPATIRPDVLNHTYRTFKDLMFIRLAMDPEDVQRNPHSEIGAIRFDYRVAIHVDPVGGLEDPADVISVAQQYFPLAFAQVNSTPHNSLAFAFYRLWSIAAKLDYEYVFYLEDDWELLMPVSLARMISIMDRYPNLATLRLPFRPTADKHSKNWRHIFPFNGDYFECPEEDKPHIGWCGHPNLVRRAFIFETLRWLHPYGCPERQMKGFWGNDMSRVIMKWDYGVYGTTNQGEAIKDIGRKWRENQEIIKLKDTSWRVKDENRRS